ncbi:MAG: hypothetical protein HW403_137, partial [Dehalococcoidia bacterium]|nr:hypothetical protein [Dehalococcoidia bacterium]
FYRSALTASSLGTAYNQAGVALGAMAMDYVIGGALLVYLGAILQYKRDPQTLILILLFFVPNLLFVSLYRVADIEDFAVFLTLLSTVWFAVGAEAVREWLSRALTHSSRALVVPGHFKMALPILALACLPLIALIYNFRYLNYSEARGPESFARDTLAALPSDAVILAQYPGWPVWYAQIVEGLRPDVSVMDPRLFLAGRWIFSGMTAGEQWVPALNRELERYGDRPLYSVLYDHFVATAWSFEAVGDLYKLSRKDSPRAEALDDSALRQGPIFGGSLRLRSAKIEPSTVRPGELVLVHISWIVEDTVQGNYDLDFYFQGTSLAEAASILSNKHSFSYRVPQGYGEFPSSHWPPNHLVEESYNLYVPESARAGAYTIFLSLVENDRNRVVSVFNGDSGPYSRIPLVEINVTSPQSPNAD